MTQAVDSSTLIKEQALDLVQKLARRAKRSTRFDIKAELVGVDDAFAGYVTLRIVNGTLGQSYKSRESAGRLIKYGGLRLENLEPEALLQIANKLV